MTQVLVFATKSDWLEVLREVESTGALRYFLRGHFSGPDLVPILSGDYLPSLGRATSDSYATCQAFLVADEHALVRARTLTMTDGQRRYAVDQLSNPDTVSLTTGGVWGEGVLINGCVGTVTESAAAQALMKRFRASFRRRFAKMKAFLVGPEAKDLLAAGWRLTTSAQSPRLYDLSAGP